MAVGPHKSTVYAEHDFEVVTVAIEKWIRLRVVSAFKYPIC